MNGIEKKFREMNTYAIDITEYDDNVRYLIGWPGYRTSKNKSGLDYLDTRAELAHTQGVMIRWLFTGKFITHNPIFLFFMALFGVLVGIIPFVMLLTEISVARSFETLFWLIPTLLPYIAIGIGLIINLFISILNPSAKSITGD